MDQPHLFAHQSASAQTAYAQLIDATVAQRAATHHIQGGSFASKSVKGRLYWYFQWRDEAGGVRQIYAGPQSETVDRLRAAYAQGRQNVESLGRLANVLALHGGTMCVPQHVRVIERLESYGFFRAGGVLVGTHAFLAMSNMLGVKWAAGKPGMEIDFAYADNVTIALPATIKVNSAAAIDSLQEGLLPLLDRQGRPRGTFVHPTQSAFTLDFLMPRKRDSNATNAERLGIAVRQVRLIDYILEGSEQAVVASRHGAPALVNIPSPARFAVHKLMVSAERLAAQRAKAVKDVAQAAAILELCLNMDVEPIVDAVRDAASRGTSWRKSLVAGFASLARRFPSIGAAYTDAFSVVRATERTSQARSAGISARR